MVRKSGRRVLAVALMVAGAASSPAALAAYTVSFLQTGNDVVATGSGSMNLNALAASFNVSKAGNVRSVEVFSGAGNCKFFTGVTAGPSPITASPGIFGANANTGSVVGVSSDVNGGIGVCVPYDGNTFLPLPNGLSNSSTWTGQTLAGLGLTPGTYNWTWGVGVNADRFTLQVGPPPAPAPSLQEWALGLLAAALALMGAAHVHRRIR